ncbi:autotransporter outer membrane beta-barrel domain-containing protein [Enterobacteriaceae bacterium H20N1]|uniref:Autotransporter outer membrane beta-barrel domain-containing protein n=1 Tax=Dryocola boscaweniae TaxID=2925397 RepID=A0A9X2W983_9ENTR|nr:autotransporter outer membrane beta-barrel domain-containing protein [Dryocola boscaweniae]MCT4703391.1 autotransporter outer membrane beta-barrel domain-containing protein [Dryocola boscaweniae]MCT4720559.1 autotransporter outer membrane beta-barrel domain-containing protein [Dryocola boscaweniae]
MTFENDTNGTFIIQAKNSADFTATRLLLNSSGNRGGGVWIDNAKFTAQDLKINVSGNSGSGIYLANNSEAMLNNIQIAAQNNALGLDLDGTWSTAQGRAIARASDSIIATAGGDAIRVMAGDLALNNVTAATLGNYSYALNANTDAKIDVEGGSFSTQGEYSDAVWIVSQESSATLNNAVITTQGRRSTAVNAQKGTANVANSILETQGENAYGLYTENQIQGDRLSITTSGTSGAGLFTALGGTGTLTNSTIMTHGELAPGLLAYPGSRINADNVQIETTGKESFGLWGRAGTLNISNSLVSTAGEEASGLYVNGYSSTAATGNSVSLDKVTLKSEQAQAINVSTAALSLEVKDSALSGGNGQLMTVSHYEDTIDPANNLYSDVAFNAANSSLNGDISVSDPGNIVKVNLTSGSVLNGAANNVTSLALDDSSHWNINNNSVVGQLTNNGTVAFSSQNRFDTLTVTGDYAGNGGALVMNSVLGSDSSPANRVIIGGDVLEGTTNISINNLGGHGAQTVEGIKIVDVGGTSLGRFVKMDRIIAGAYDYDLIKQGESWYLTSSLANSDTAPEPTPDSVPAPTPAPAPVPVPAPGLVPAPAPDVVPVRQPKAPPAVRPEAASYTANLAAANTLFMMSLHDRLGETQFINMLTGQKEVTSLWLRQIGAHNVWRDASGQLKTQSNRYIAQIGGDVARWSTDGQDRWHVGFMAGYGNNHSNSHNRLSGYSSRGSVDGYSIGGYATWYANKENHTGAWLDSWLQYSWFNNEVKGEMLTAESYKSHGITASLESGYTWKAGQFLGSRGSVNEWFIQPKAQAVWMGVRADNHHEANGTRVSDDGQGNVMTRLGIRTFLKSHHERDKNKQREFQPYIELSWLHNTRDFAARLDDARVSQSGASNLGEVKVGLEGQINPRLNLWGNVSVQMGDTGYNDSAAMIGMKYNF